MDDRSGSISAILCESPNFDASDCSGCYLSALSLLSICSWLFIPRVPGLVGDFWLISCLIPVISSLSVLRVLIGVACIASVTC